MLDNQTTVLEKGIKATVIFRNYNTYQVLYAGRKYLFVSPTTVYEVKASQSMLKREFFRHSVRKIEMRLVLAMKIVPSCWALLRSSVIPMI